MTIKLRRILLITALLFLFIQSCSSVYAPQPLLLSIIHINDTHSHLEPDAAGETMRFYGVDTKAFLGGFARLKSAINTLRANTEHTILLHAGDAVQGTLYFNKFSGRADMELLNLFGIDAMTFGNHEFDRGPLLVKDILDWAQFPILSANIDFSGEPLLAGRTKPYIIKNFGRERVAIIGVTTEETAEISSPGQTITFRDVKESVQRTVAELLRLGINKIIVLSHIGYEMDKRLASEVSGVDIVVGGHSHTLLGTQELRDFALKPEGDYPTMIITPEGKRALIVQAWRWGEVLGNLKVKFDERGEIENYEGRPFIIMNERFMQKGQEVPQDSETYQRIIGAIIRSSLLRIFTEDFQALSMIAPFKAQVDEMRKTTIAIAENDLRRDLNSGPGPLVVDSLLKKTNSDIALINRGSIRKDLFAGNITVGDVFEILPFGNTLYLLQMKGSEVKQALEDGIDYQLTHNPTDPYYPYVAGIHYKVKPKAAKGNRVYSILCVTPEGNLNPIQMDKVYKFVTLSFIAKQGGDGFVFFADFKGYRVDTGMIDADVFMEYLTGLSRVYNPTEERIYVESDTAALIRFRYLCLIATTKICKASNSEAFINKSAAKAA